MADTEPRSTEPRSTEPQADPAVEPESDPSADPTAGSAAADGDQPPQGPPAPDNESSTGGAGGNRDAEGEAEASRRTRRRTGIRIRRTVLAIVLVLLVPLLTAETALRINYMGDPADGTYTRNRDAMWLGHAWVDGRKKDADLKALARELKTTGIRDLYVHTGPMEHDGTLPKSLYPRARWLVDGVHREMPGIRVQAFLGDVLATESPDGMCLEKADTRAAVVDSARQVLDVGYDGVHLDLEPLHSGDRNYLSLLDDIRAVTRARDAQLSVAAHQIDPLPGFHSFWGTVAGHPKWWSQEFFGQVARRVDQIAVMSYDTMQPLESLYGGYVAQQTSLALEVTPPTTHLLMGLPFYHENRFGHWNHAETVAAAVRGVRLGLSRTDADRERFGVAAYIDFAATEEDWASYREGWVR
ncbi:glycosyl hydrolase family 18 protein [Streptomyces coelicoflavus]|uniref:glycoside hydrolase family 18 protein n=1 Tax=Streptomyces coelicoflavus TaxID=285562 RepID=UPI0024AD8D08|nr:glycosyl hydrolase family 18 protein [Streptomyces coelicoflavus]MDI6517596.1 glycosyl hydrolase family 18 protein [Streptomyces coelicoflavus]